MKVAVPIWNDRVSPVFDTSKRLLVVEFVGGEEIGREEYALADLFPPLRVRRLKDIGVELLICGAVSNPVALLIDAAGIELVPWVSGSVSEVIDAFNREKLTDSRYRMPGCRGRGRGFRWGMRCAGARGFGHGRLRGGHRGGWQEIKEERDENSGNSDR
jgi:predicted Fe-Mo cluster-binding NifX family protein